MTQRRALLLSLLCLAGCGPSEQEGGLSVLISAPIVLGISLELLYFLTWLGCFLEPKGGPPLLWKDFLARVEARSRPPRVMLLVSFVLSVLSVVYVARTEDYRPLEKIADMGLTGIIIFGTSFLSVALVFWRLCLFFSRQAAFWACLVVAVCLVLPALPMAAGLNWGWDDFMFPAWVFPGFIGMVTGPLFVIFLLEAGIRRYLRRRAPQNNL